MNKQDFLAALEEGLAGLPRDEIDGRLAFYGEMIDDRVEDGLSEEEAVEGIGPVKDVVAQITSEIPLTKLVRERVRGKRALKGWEIALIVIGSPVWAPLLLSLLAVIFTLYIVLWVLVAVLYVVAASFAVSAVGCAAGAAVQFAQGQPAGGFLMIGTGLFLAGLSILLFKLSVVSTKGAARLLKKIITGIKSLFIGKEKTK